MPSPQNRRRALVLADQAASSLSNVVVAILVARSFPEDAEPFAAFSLAIMMYQFIIGCVRGLVSEPVLSLYSDRPSADRSSLIPSYLGATLTVAVAISVIVALASTVVGGMAGSALLALAIVLPFVLVEDAWRFMFIIDRPGAALLIDVVWLAFSCVAIVMAPGDVGVGWYVLAWGVGGGLGALVAIGLGRHSLGRLRAWSYIVEHRATGLRFLGEYVTAQAGNYIALLACGWILGLASYGAVRAGNFYFGPLFTLQAGVILSVLPEATRLRAQPDKLARLIHGATGIVGAATIAWTLVGLVLPASAGRALFGAAWEDASGILIPMGIAMLGMAMIAGGLVGVRALDGTKGLAARLRSIPFQVACPIAGAFVGDVLGFAIGMAIGQAVAAAVWWSTFRALLDGARRAVGATGSADEVGTADEIGGTGAPEVPPAPGALATEDAC